MKRFTYILLVLILTSSCSHSYDLKVTIDPNHIEKAEITVCFRADSISSIELNNYYFNEKGTLKNKDFKALNRILDDYHFVEDKMIEIHEEILSLDATSINIDASVDGFLLKENNFQGLIHYSLPSRDSANYDLINKLIEITSDCFKTTEIQKYLTELKSNCNNSQAVDFNKPNPYVFQKEYYSLVKKYPVFVGGDSSLISYIRKEVQQNTIINSYGLTGRVYLNFIINKDGSIANVNTLRGIQKEIDNECEDIIRNMPNWIPGERYGHKVKVSYNIPVKINWD